MFGLLKNKLASFISGLAGREEKKPTPSPKEAAPEDEKADFPFLPAQQKVAEAAGQKAQQKSSEPQAKPVHGAEKKAESKTAPNIPAIPPAEKKPEPKTGPAARPVHAAEGKPETKTVPHAQIPRSSEKPGPKISQPPGKPETELEPHAAAVHAAEKKPEISSWPNAAVSHPAEAKPEAATGQNAAVSPPDEKKPETKAALPTSPARASVQTEASRSQAAEPDLSRLEKRASAQKKETAPRIGLGKAIKSFFSGEVTIGEAEVADLIGELELSLLEADVEYGVSMEVASQLRSRLVGMKVPKGEVAGRTREAIGQVLESIMSSQRSFDFLKRVQESPRPVKILFVGPNGAGKTTTMAKVARMLSDAGMTSVFSASDTFRAAAIEQTEAHGERLGIRVVKSKYGADPASVAFDAINFARSHAIDVVLIDSAGRQDTNANLLAELKKISRVAKPDLKIYVGESIGGNALIDQVRAFDEAIGIDGAILTKLDCDAKGGTAISITRATGIPVLFLGVGQRYEDLVPFDARKIAHEIMT